MLFVSRLHPTRLFASSNIWKVGRRCVSGVRGKEMLIKKPKDEQLEALERMASTEIPPDFDTRSQRMQIFDIRFPSSISSTAPGIKPKVDWTKTFMIDKFRSVLGLRQAYDIGMLPPPRPSIFTLLRLNSPGLANIALSLYAQMNYAYARGDLRALSRACIEEQFDKLRLKIKSRPKSQTIVWKIDEANSRVDILSVRCLDAWGNKKAEDFCMQALVRFDTRQAIAVYGPSGKLISGDPNKTVRVREHLLLEKKNWAQELGWGIRAPKYLTNFGQKQI
ncbi:hypothetical protein FRC07_011401 [Ceratobasidium sp. 392]|nr:hypothetical protein FRC07_011401 [Ceratobasidium sp. 392]